MKNLFCFVKFFKSDKNFRAAQGFTLIEVLIVIAITALLASFIIIYGSTAREQTSLFVEEAKIMNLILQAKSLSVTTLASSTGAVIELPCAYGFEVDYANNTYSIVAYVKDFSGQCLASGGLDGGTGNLDTSRIVYLPNEVFTPENNLTLVKNSDSLDDVLFRPPEPTTYLFPTAPAAPVLPSRKIYIQSANGATSGVILVSEAGQVTTQ